MRDNLIETLLHVALLSNLAHWLTDEFLRGSLLLVQLSVLSNQYTLGWGGGGALWLKPDSWGINSYLCPAVGNPSLVGVFRRVESKILKRYLSLMLVKVKS